MEVVDTRLLLKQPFALPPPLVPLPASPHAPSCRDDAGGRRFLGHVIKLNQRAANVQAKALAVQPQPPPPPHAHRQPNRVACRRVLHWQ